MPSGCELVCLNSECEYYNTGFNVTNKWDLAPIKQVINCQKLRRNPDFKASLEKKMNDGAKFACIVFPNNEGIETHGYRLNHWCDKCKMVIITDCIENENEEILITEPDKCFKCEGKLIDFKDIIDEKTEIQCPKCNKNLEKRVWFAKSEDDEAKFMKRSNRKEDSND